MTNASNMVEQKTSISVVVYRGFFVLMLLAALPDLFSSEKVLAINHAQWAMYGLVAAPWILLGLIGRALWISGKKQQLDEKQETSMLVNIGISILIIYIVFYHFASHASNLHPR